MNTKDFNAHFKVVCAELRGQLTVHGDAPTKLYFIAPTTTQLVSNIRFALRMELMTRRMIGESWTIRKLCTRRISLAKEILIEKAKEYSSDTDRLYNFKQAAKITKCLSPENCLIGMWSKHLVSCHDLSNRRIEITQARLDEKFGDAFNYAILYSALAFDLDAKKESFKCV